MKIEENEPSHTLGRNDGEGHGVCSVQKKTYEPVWMSEQGS
jgi:hypothetical protein